MKRPEGWFGYNEGKGIQEVVNFISPDMIIVEIGTWCGLSTSYIAEVMTGRQTLITIDNYLDNSEASCEAHLKPQDAHRKFLEFFFNNMLYKKKIVPIIGSSTEIAEIFKTASINIDFLFIDGDHKYESVKADYNAWSVFNPVYIAFHDYNNSVEVKRFVDEIKDGYKHFKLIESLAILRK